MSCKYTTAGTSFFLTDSQKCFICKFSLKYQHLIQHTGDENRQDSHTQIGRGLRHISLKYKSAFILAQMLQYDRPFTRYLFRDRYLVEFLE